jgi:hypothetical protein
MHVVWNIAETVNSSYFIRHFHQFSFDRSDDYLPCQHIGCTAIYCRECFEELDNTCSLCMEPMEYGDFSDISEEVYVYSFALHKIHKI